MFLSNKASKLSNKGSAERPQNRQEIVKALADGQITRGISSSGGIHHGRTCCFGNMA